MGPRYRQSHTAGARVPGAPAAASEWIAASAARAAGKPEMFLQQRAQPTFFLVADAVANFGAAHKFVVAIVASERIAKNVGEPAGHAGPEIHARGAQDYGDARGHVFATVMAGAFDDGERATIAHGKAFADAPSNKKFSAGRAVQHRVTCQHVAAF